MVNPHVHKFDLFVLKPIWLGLLTMACVSLFHADWLTASLLFVCAVFGVGAIEASMQRASSLVQNEPELDEYGAAIDGPAASMDDATSYLLGKAMVRLGALASVMATLISFHFGFRWYFALLAGLVGWAAGLMLTGLMLAIVYGLGGKARR